MDSRDKAASFLVGAPPRRSTSSLGLMSESILIRRYEPGEEPALFDVYFTAIHLVASHDYTDEQIHAWAPRDIDAALWTNKMREINPFVAELHGEVVGYADVQ